MAKDWGRAVRQELLFNGERFYNFVENQQENFKSAYDRLPDDEALEAIRVEKLKQSFMMHVPTLKQDTRDWSLDDSGPGFVIYIPFDGDRNVFQIAPEAENGTIAAGTVRDQELILKVYAGPDYDVTGHVKRELSNIEWRLNYLRDGNDYLQQQLDITAAESVTARRHVIESRAKAKRDLGIPRREPTVPAPSVVLQKPVNVERPSAKVEKAARNEEWDVFVSHASADKDYVRPLVKELKAAGIRVWYDEDNLAWGDQLRRGINEGLAKSRFAIVVLSKAFLAQRKWTEHEFAGLFAREELGKVVILPIWHGIKRDDLLLYDPALADRMAAISATDIPTEIVNRLLNRLGIHRPESENMEERAPASRALDSGAKEERPLVAYALYEQKGPGAQRGAIYVRRSNFLRDGYVLIDGDREHDGDERDVSTRFFLCDKSFEADGFGRMNFSNVSGNRAFDLP